MQEQHLIRPKGTVVNYVTQPSRQRTLTEVVVWLHVGLFAKESEKAEVSNVYLGSSLRGSDEKVSVISKRKVA